MNRKLVMLLFLVLLTRSLTAQVPAGFNYQAVVRNPAGEVLGQQSVSIRLSLLSGGSEGVSVYRESHHLTTSATGLVQLTVGAGSGSDDFDRIDWMNLTEVWLKTELDLHDGRGYQLMGSQQLMSVPFSMVAGQAAPTLPVVNNQERNAILHPKEGQMLLNQESGKINIYHNQQWHQISLESISGGFTCGNDLTDQRDGQVYKTIQLGSQCWMAENLNIGSQVNGEIIPSDNGIIEKYCYQNSATSCEQYGGLYPWNELMGYSSAEGTQGICPDGWHIPSDQEVQDLEIFLGMSATDAARSNVWRGSNQGLQLGAGGSSGFEVLYGGRRVTGGMFTAAEQYAYFWTSTASGDAAWRRCLRPNDGTIGRYDSFPKDYGMSVRCLKD